MALFINVWDAIDKVNLAVTRQASSSAALFVILILDSFRWQKCVVRPPEYIQEQNMRQFLAIKVGD